MLCSRWDARLREYVVLELVLEFHVLYLSFFDLFRAFLIRHCRRLLNIGCLVVDVLHRCHLVNVQGHTRPDTCQDFWLRGQSEGADSLRLVSIVLQLGGVL